MTEHVDVPNTNKAFVPLENNPEVMSHLVHQLGLPPTLGFTDIYSIDEPDLLALPVMWFKQTIRNACGLIGLLHAVANGEPRKHVVPGSDLDTLLREAEPLGPIARADLLYESKALESAHADAARAVGEGRLADDEDALSDKALELGVRRFLQTEVRVGNPDLRFSLVSLGPSFD
ncbi:cysteine proteinase [Aspergillus novofumigatus IBT 16806]|uniref:ubiquitinyl hydrolase 1 n=1 Tax=Aspergillus novofumigatus (strain IBT 16806) TaxID=1392255 RepID=A0A2I1CLK6_ASPN1|nr:cysteine proteinase [Aspergillus novofumigatus IBT 16806]PKX98486.1 cysteine proteinase [Aspergillus novofumigatus IBT 16806]